MSKNRNKKTGLKGYIWLLMAVFCIVFSGATKWFIEQQVSHDAYSSIVPYAKRIKDHSRDKRQSLTAVFHADHSAGSDDVLNVSFLLTALVSFVLLYLFTSRTDRVSYALHPVMAQRRLLYLRDSRLQV